MTRKITIAIWLSVLASVLLAGVGTLLTSRYEARQAAQANLQGAADSVALLFTELPLATTTDTDVIRARLLRIQEELRLLDAEFLVINAAGDVSGQLPDSLDEATIDIDQLVATGKTSGIQGSVVYAASYGQRRNFDFVVLFTSDDSSLTKAISRWILFSTLVALALGAIVAWALGRRLARPIAAASEASMKIAGGDLSARLNVPEGKRADEIATLSTNINDMAASLDRSRLVEQQFLLSVSHDLRTPLTSIRGYAEAIGDGTAPDVAQAAGVIGTESQRLERLVTDLLDLAKLDARQFSLRPQEVDLDQLVPDVVAGFEREATQSGLNIIVDGPDTELAISTDPDRLAQVIANLIENAVKFASHTVTVRYGATLDGYEIVVADDGPGIATEDLPHIFERLYVTSHTPARREIGSGLGLAIVHELVAALGGTVHALPRPSGGAQFVVAIGR